ncbi:hypothetical protein IFM89_010406 [Coptis chinensis]|uniref:Pentatricopeptide repeat-containing protein n=1 Tax=Coptis chinensis TaxID=261450 RepID=A0A835H2U8_9MAGN|nr:hypothetical protein IFM89_010406 [Coptis chinensis]
MGYQLIQEFWRKPILNIEVSLGSFVECLVYTYKDWGSDVFVFDLFFKVLVEVGLFDEARKFFDKMLSYGVVLSVDSCNFLLSRLSNCPNGSDIVGKIFSEFPELGVCWNVVSYNIMMHALCKLERVEEALALFGEMESKGCGPDVVSYSTVIDGYCHLGELQKALELVREMRVKGMLEDGERLLSWMLEKGIMPNATTYNSLMKQYCIGNNMKATTKVYRGMCGQGVVPNNNTYNILIEGHSKARNMKEACYFHSEMVGKGFGLRASSYNALIRGLLKKKRMEEARKLFEQMRTEGLVADKEIYNIFLDLNYDEGNMQMTLELCDEAIEKCLIDKTPSEHR